MLDKKIILYNLIFFSIITIIVIFHYLSHFNQLQNEIFNYVEIQAKSIAKRIEIAASNVYRSHKFVKTIISNSLKSQAKLIDLLNSIEPFKIQELKDFSEETGVDIICIVKNNKKLCNGSFPFIKNYKFNGIKFFQEKNLILYYYKGEYSNAIIITGIYAKQFFAKQKKFSVNFLINKILDQREDIKEIKIINGSINKIDIKILKNKFYLVKVPFEAQKNKIILIKIDATYLLNILYNFKHNLNVFIFVMILIGIIGNIIIYFIQKKYLKEIRKYEKRLLQNEKFVALGRSAGILAHEIRNPLNAIGIGLQRILYETDIVNNKEYKNLLDTILDELKRVNDKITTFIDYTKPVNIKKEKIKLKNFIEDITIYYKNELKIIIEISDNLIIHVDKNLFREAIINLVKNAVENKKSTYLKITAMQKRKEFFIEFENDGIDNNIDPDTIFEPYFTTKINGSGLGLAIVKKIIESHNGTITCNISNNKIKFTIKIKEEKHEHSNC